MLLLYQKSHPHTSIASLLNVGKLAISKVAAFYKDQNKPATSF